MRARSGGAQRLHGLIFAWEARFSATRPIARRSGGCYKRAVSAPGKEAVRESLIERFRAAIAVPEHRVDLVGSALLIAQSEYANLDHAVYCRSIEEFGREARDSCSAISADRAGERLAQLSRLFAERWGFHGNAQDYYDPRNSFLNDVLDRRTGIPITLSLVYIEVGRRAGLELVGVGMPGHFLVGCAHRNDLYVDAFSGGALLTPQDCAARLRELRPNVVFRPEFLEPVGSLLILTRMLNNLLGIYLNAQLFSKALPILEMILCLQPDEPEWLRSRALVHYHLKNYARAIADLGRYLELVPEAPDREGVVQQLSVLHQLRSMVN
jgi:regulator of sirC expression with transglutaminase-like and TPR domain